MLCRALTIGLLILELLGGVHSHGYLWDPPGRSTAWRKGLTDARNYGDMGLFCGGKKVQWSENGGKCGLCGDAYNARIKPNEDVDGKYVKKRPIVATYTKGQVVEIVARLTAYHFGHFRFRLCVLPDYNTKVTEECLAENILTEAGTGIEWIDTTTMEKSSKTDYITYIQLPEHVTCEFCVLQWWWRTGNSWACPTDGDCCGMGCGPQETFVNCADIRIVYDDKEASNDDDDNIGYGNTGSDDIFDIAGEDTLDTFDDNTGIVYTGYENTQNEYTGNEYNGNENTGNEYTGNEYTGNYETLDLAEDGTLETGSYDNWGEENDAVWTTEALTTKAPPKTNGNKNKKQNDKNKPNKKAKNKKIKENEKAKNKKLKNKEKNKKLKDKAKTKKLKNKNKQKTKPKKNNQNSGNESTSPPVFNNSQCPGSEYCTKTGQYARCTGLKTTSEWCCQNCNHIPSFCPASFCCCE